MADPAQQPAEKAPDDGNVKGGDITSATTGETTTGGTTTTGETTTGTTDATTTDTETKTDETKSGILTIIIPLITSWTFTLLLVREHML